MVLFCPGISALASLLSPQKAALTSRSSKLRSVGEEVPLALHEELLRRDASKTATAATKVALATRGAPPLGIRWSVTDENLSKSVASSRSLGFHWELESWAVSGWPSWIDPAPKLKENGSENSLLEKIYNVFFYSVFEYIHQHRLLPHVKYCNSNFTRILKIKLLSRHPNVKNKISLNVICQKEYTIPYSTLFWSIYINSICSLI